jgi:hypothetical protein
MSEKQIKQLNDHLALLAKIRDRNKPVKSAHKIGMRGSTDKSREHSGTSNSKDSHPTPEKLV